LQNSIDTGSIVAVLIIVKWKNLDELGSF